MGGVQESRFTRVGISIHTASRGARRRLFDTALQKLCYMPHVMLRCTKRDRLAREYADMKFWIVSLAAVLSLMAMAPL